MVQAHVCPAVQCDCSSGHLGPIIFPSSSQLHPLTFPALHPQLFSSFGNVTWETIMFGDY